MDGYAAAPYIERELALLTRDLDNALSKYHEIKAKEMQAQLAEVLEEGQKGERLTLIEPPLLPESLTSQIVQRCCS